MTERLGVRRSELPLATLGLAAFVVGTSELVVVGILDPIAEDTGVSIDAVRQLGGALGIALFGGLAADGIVAGMHEALFIAATALTAGLTLARVGPREPGSALLTDTVADGR